MLHRLARLLVEQMRRVFTREQHALGHAVVQQRSGGIQLVGGERLGAAEQTALQAQPVLGDALDALDWQAAVMRDVGRLAGPWRHRAETRRDDDQRAVERPCIRLAVAKQRLELVELLDLVRERRLTPDPMHMAGMDAGDARAHRLQFLQQGLGAKVGERVAALEVKQVLGGLAHAAARRWLGNAVRPEVSKGPPKAENPGLRYLSPNGES